VIGALLALWCLLAPAAWAQATPAPVMPSVPARVVVAVTVIEARTSGDRIDPEVVRQARAQANSPYKSFVLLDRHRMRLADGQAGEVPLDGARRVLVTLTSHGPERARVHLEQHAPGREPVLFDLTVHRDRAMLYVAKGGPGQPAHVLEVAVRY
jgi:hypothetical protein